MSRKNHLLLIYVTGALLLAIVAISGYQSFQIVRSHNAKNSALHYLGSTGWQWQNESIGVQIKQEDGYSPALRKVNLDEDYAALITLSDKGEYRGFVFFNAACEPGSVISETKYVSPTGEQSSSVLHCIEGKLVYIQTWPTGIPSERWADNVGAYAFDVNLTNWNFKPLVKAYYMGKGEAI